MIDKYTYVYLGTKIDYYKFGREQSAFDCERVLVCEHVLNNMNWFLRSLFRLHTSTKTNRFFNLPFKCIWNKYFISKEVRKTLKDLKNICFCISGLEYWYAKNGLPRYLKKEFPFSKVLFFLTDTVDFYLGYYKKFDLKKVIHDFDFVLTYNHADSIKYGLPVPPPKIISYSCIDSSQTEKCDVFFVGRNKGRLDKIIEIANICNKAGLSCHFHIMGVSDGEQIPCKGIYYGDYMPYLDVLKYEKRSRCLLNLYQKNSDGITMRDAEAIGMNKFLITDGKAILKSDFFTDCKILIADNLESELDKINDDNEKIEWNNKSSYSVENYFRWLDKLIQTF